MKSKAYQEQVARFRWYKAESVRKNKKSVAKSFIERRPQKKGNFWLGEVRSGIPEGRKQKSNEKEGVKSKSCLGEVDGGMVKRFEEEEEERRKLNRSQEVT